MTWGRKEGLPRAEVVRSLLFMVKLNSLNGTNSYGVLSQLYTRWELHWLLHKSIFNCEKLEMYCWWRHLIVVSYRKIWCLLRFTASSSSLLLMPKEGQGGPGVAGGHLMLPPSSVRNQFDSVMVFSYTKEGRIRPLLLCVHSPPPPPPFQPRANIQVFLSTM